MADPQPGVMAPPDVAPGQAEYQERLQRDGQQAADGWKTAKIEGLMTAGTNPRAIDAFFGEGALEHAPTDDHVATNFRRLAPGADPKTGELPPSADTTVGEGFQAGISRSWLGTVIDLNWEKAREAAGRPVWLPPSSISANAGFSARLASAVGQAIGDFPATLASFATPGGLIAKGAAAGGLPTAAREVMVDAFRSNLPGAPQTFTDWTTVAAHSLAATAQAAAVGGLSLGAGGVVGGQIAKAGGGAVISAIAQNTTMAATATGISGVMDHHVPDAQDFLVNAVPIVALGVAAHALGTTGARAPGEAPPEAGDHVMTPEEALAARRAGLKDRLAGLGKEVSTSRVAHNLAEIYTKTGMPPWEVAERAKTDLAIREEVLSQDTEGDPVTPHTRAAAAPEAPALPRRPLDSLEEHRLQSQDIEEKNSASPAHATMDFLIPKLEGGLDRAGNPRISPTGAVGEFQIEPYTARSYGLHGTDAEITEQLKDPDTNRRVFQTIKADLQKRYPGDVLAQATAYNAGPKWANRLLTKGAGTRYEAIPDRTVKGGIRYESVPAARDESFLREETRRYLANARRLSRGGIGVPEYAGPAAVTASPVEEDAAANAKSDEEVDLRPSDPALGEAWDKMSDDMRERVNTAASEEAKGVGDKDNEEANAKQAATRFLIHPDLLPPVEPSAAQRAADAEAEGMATGKGTGGAANVWENASPEEKVEEGRRMVGERPTSKGPGVSELWRRWVTELAPARAADDAEIKAGKFDRKTQLGMEDHFRHVYDADAILDLFQHKGRVSAGDRSVDYKAATMSKVMDSIAAKKGNLDEFETWLLAKRAVDLHARGIETGFNEQWAASTASDPTLSERYSEANGIYQSYRDGLLAFAQRAGLFNQAQISAMAMNNPNWISFQRLMGDAPRGGAGTDLGAMSTVLRKIEGGDGKIVKPLMTGELNAKRLISSSLKNQARQAILDRAAADPDFSAFIGLKKAGDGGPVDYDAVDKELKIAGFSDDQLEGARKAYGPLIEARLDRNLQPNEFPVYQNGTREVYSVSNPAFAELIKAAQGGEEVKGVLAAIAGMQRAGIVLDPGFQVRIVGPLHELNAWLWDPNHPAPFYTLARGIPNVFRAWFKDGDEMFDRAQANGAFGGIVSDMGKLWGRPDVQAEFERQGVMDRLWNSIKSPREFAQTAMRLLTSPLRFLAESRNVGAFKTLLEKGLEPLKAGSSSAKIGVDYREAAAGKLAAQYGAADLFFHPRMLGLKMMLEGAKNDPKGVLIRGIGGFTLPALIGWSLNYLQDKENKGKPGYQAFSEMPRYITDTHFVLPEINGFRLQMPLPWAVGPIFVGSVNRVMDALVKHDPHWSDEYIHDFLNSVGFSQLLPSAVTPALDVMTNWNEGLGRQLVPDSLKEQLPADRYTPNTTPFAKALGAVIGDTFPRANLGENTFSSPIAIDHMIQGYLGPLGIGALRVAGAPFDPKPWEPQAADAPVLGSFFARNPKMNSRSIEDFYATAKGYEMEKASFSADRKRLKEGESVNMDELHAQDLSAAAQVAKIRQVMSMQRSIYEAVRNNTTMTDGERTKYEDQAIANSVLAAQFGSAFMEKNK